MAHIDFKKRTVTAKVVYYGCGLCGKTASLEYINGHSKNTSELVAVSTEGDRTIFFDFLPMSVGKIRGIETQFKLYAVPGQVRYNMTRKLVLKDVDGVVFVVDSQSSMLRANLNSLRNLYTNLREQGVDVDSIPVVLHYNKRDLGGIMSIAELQRKFNDKNYDHFAGSAVTGEGIFEALDHVCRLVFDSIWKSMQLDEKETLEAVAASAQLANTVSGDGPVTAEGAQDEKDETTAEFAAQPEAGDRTPPSDAQERTVSAPTTPPALLAASGKLESLVDELRGLLREGVLATPRPSEDVTPPAATAPPPDVQVQAQLDEALEATKQHAAKVDELGHALKQEQIAVTELTSNLSAAQAHADEAKRELAELVEARASGPEGDVDTLRTELQDKRTAFNETRAAYLKSEKRCLELERELRDLSRAGGKPGKASKASDESGRKNTELQLALDAKTADLDAALRKLAVQDAAPRSSPIEPVSPPDAGAAKRDAQGDEEADAEPQPQQGAKGGVDAAHAPERTEQQEPTVGKPEEGEPVTEDVADTFKDQPDHKNAGRVARVLVSDLLLYHKDEIHAGLRANNVLVALAEPLEESRKTFESRVSSEVRSQRDYFASELQAMLDKQAQTVGLDPGTPPTAKPKQIDDSSADAATGDTTVPGASSDDDTAEAAANAPASGDSSDDVATEAAASAPAPGDSSDDVAAVTGTSAPDSDDSSDENTADSGASVPVSDNSSDDGAADSLPAAADTPDAESGSKDTSPSVDADEGRFADNREHKNARRIARVMISDLALYHQAELKAGAQDGNIETLLADQLAEARGTYEARVAQAVRNERDYFRIEFDKLVEGYKANSGGGTSPEQTADPNAPPSPAAPVPVAEVDPWADNREHKNARRVARVMVADLFLYNKDVIERGIETDNVEEELADQIAEARKTFEARVPNDVRESRDYFAMEFDKVLASNAARVSQASDAATEPSEAPRPEPAVAP